MTKTKNNLGGRLPLVLVTLLALVLSVAVPAGAYAHSVTPAAGVLQQNWSKVHSGATNLTGCILPSDPSIDGCFHTGTHLTWTLTLSVCASSTTCTSTNQREVNLTAVVDLLPPGETYLAGTQSAVTNPSFSATFSTGSCAGVGAPSDCAAAPGDNYLEWTFATVPLNGTPDATFTYQANLTAVDGTELTDTAIAHYTVAGLSQNPPVADTIYVANAILDIAKTCPADVANNSAIVYGINLTNSGHAGASSATVLDAAPAGVTFTSASATSPTASFTPTLVNWTGAIPADSTVNVTVGANINTSANSVTNYANYTAYPPTAVLLHESASCTTVIVHPAIHVVKVVSPTLVSDVRSHQINITATVTNIGDTTLYNLTAVDTLGLTLTCDATTLAVGAETNCTGSYTIPMGDSANYSNDTVNVSANDKFNQVVYDEANASVQIIHPEISVVKSVSVSVVSNLVNTTVNITANVTNTGDTTLYNVSAVDSIAGTLSCPIATLAPGASENCTGSYVILKGTSAAWSNDTVTATGNDTFNNTVSDNDSASVQIVHPAISVVKSVDPTSVVNNVNSTINVTAVVTNTGDITLYHVSVNDTLAGGLTCASTTLAPGASTNCTGSYNISAGTPVGFSNDTVTASGCDGSGNCVNDTSNASVEITAPSVGGVTDTNFCPLPNDQFRLIFNNFAGHSLQLKSTNPGQFYYNVYTTSGWTTGTTLTVTIPFPFVTSGATPIQVFQHAPPTCPSSPPSTNLNSEFQITPMTFGLSSYSSASFASTMTVTIKLTGPSIPSGTQLWVAIHLNYGLKGQLFQTLQPGATGCPTPASTGVCAKSVSYPSLIIGNPQPYTFSNSFTGSTTVSSFNSVNGASPAAVSSASARASALAPVLGVPVVVGLAFAVFGLVAYRRKGKGGERSPSGA